MSMLTVNQLRVSYGKKEILHGLDFSLEKGTILGVIGPNGAGKSTLLRAISGVIPFKGEVRIAGQDIRQMNEVERAQHAAFVPQARNLPAAFTAWEMVQLGRTPYLGFSGALSERDITIVRRSMEKVDSLELADRRLGSMSGGEQQRLLLARALAQQAPLLLMDEPTTHLDLSHQMKLLREVRALVETDGLTAVMALHDLNLVGRFSDQVLLIADGSLQAFGTPAEVLTAERLSEVYQLELQIIEREQAVPLIYPALL